MLKKVIRYSSKHASYVDLSPTRQIVGVYGPDAQHFLQGLTSNSLIGIEANGGQYSCFLTPTGRMMFDTFIFPMHNHPEHRDRLQLASNDHAYFIDCDGNEVDRLYKSLKRYKLRAKCKLERIDWLSVYSLQNCQHADGSVACLDTRSSYLAPASRLLHSPTSSLGIEAESQTIQEYTKQRYAAGVAEGQAEIWFDGITPLEANMDLAQGVDFNKGCYVGQELTARTHYTGVVRKRIVPVELQSSPSDASILPASQSNLIKAGGGVKGRPVGKFIAGLDNTGLALLRLDLIHQGAEFQVADGTNSIIIKGRIPTWWPEKVSQLSS